MGLKTRASLGFIISVCAVLSFSPRTQTSLLLVAAVALGAIGGVFWIQLCARRNETEAARLQTEWQAVWAGSATVENLSEAGGVFNAQKNLEFSTSKPHGYLVLCSDRLRWLSDGRAQRQGIEDTEWDLSDVQWVRVRPRRDISGLGYWQIEISIAGDLRVIFNAQGDRPPPIASEVASS